MYAEPAGLSVLQFPLIYTYLSGEMHFYRPVSVVLKKKTINKKPNVLEMGEHGENNLSCFMCTVLVVHKPLARMTSLDSYHHLCYVPGDLPRPRSRSGSHQDLNPRTSDLKFAVLHNLSHTLQYHPRIKS